MDLVVGASSGAVKSLVTKLGSLLAQEYALIGGVGDDIQYINDELASMEAFLSLLKQQDAGHNKQRQDWMKQVREVSYDIEDCIDNVNRRLSGEPRGSDKLVFLRRAWYLFTTLYARRCIAAEIGNLKIRAQHVSERRTRYGVIGVENLSANDGGGNKFGLGADAPGDNLAPLPRLIGTMEPVGVEDDINILQKWFVKPEHNTQQMIQNKTNFIAIVGFGGLGKTTLALALYRRFGHEFDCRAFVLASQKFDLLEVMRKLIMQLHEQQAGADQDALQGIEV
uniref:Rx N-terminal domain-containing protein n=1 Tax=Leersia perrieri TaxID=77586 RepID=A0A0D9XU03_9ORYZ